MHKDTLTQPRQKSIKYLEKQAQKARDYFKAHLYLWIAVGWEMNLVVISIKPDGSKKVQPLTDSTGNKIWIKSPEQDLGCCNAILGYNSRFVTLDIDSPGNLNLPKNFPTPLLKIKTGRGFHLRFLNGDFEKSIKLSFGEVIFKNYGIFMDGSYHAPTDTFYEIIEQNQTTDRLYQKDIQQFLKKSTRKNKYAPGNRNINLNRDVFIDVAKNQGENVSKILKMYKTAGLSDNEIQRTTKSAIQGALDKGVSFQEDEKKEKVIYTPSDDWETDIQNRFNALDIQVRYNIRDQVEEIKKGKDGKWKVLNDGEDAILFSDVQKNIDCTEKKPVKKIPINIWNKITSAIFYRNKIDPFVKYLKSLPEWDKEKRLEGVLSELFTVKGNKEIAKWAFKTVLLMAVKRTFQPGTKFDNMIILIGEQNIGKSSLWSCLFQKPSWFSDSISFSGKDKEIIEVSTGCVIIENAELAGAKKADLEKIKALITRQSDKIRFAYARKVSVIPRQFVFVGTTNEIDDALPNDPTGLRRFVPVHLGKKQKTVWENGKKVREYITQNRSQLWAEALSLFKAKESHFLPVKLHSTAKEEAEQHRSKNEYLEESVLQIVFPPNEHPSPKGEYTMEQIIQNLVKNEVIAKGQAHIGVQREIGGILRKAGFKKRVGEYIDHSNSCRKCKVWVYEGKNSYKPIDEK